MSISYFVTKGVALLGTMLWLSNPLRIEIFLIRKRIVLQYILERSDSCILGSKYAVRIFEWACMTNRQIEQKNKYITIYCELENSSVFQYSQTLMEFKIILKE